MKFDSLLNLMGFTGRAHGSPPTSGCVSDTEMPDGPAPSKGSFRQSPANRRRFGTIAEPIFPASPLLLRAALVILAALSLALLLSSDPAAAQEPSSDAGLRDLYLHGHPFTQTFDPARTEYAATVGQDQTRVFVRARANHSEATAAIDDERSTPGGWLIVSLAPRPSCIAVVVTAEDGTTTRTYAIGIDGTVPGPACTTPESPSNQLSITPTKPWRWPSQPDDLSFTVGGLVDGDLADDVVTGRLSREPGNAEGSYAINMGTLAVTDGYAEKYGLPNAPTIATYDIEPWPHTLSIWLTKPWKRLGEADDLSYTLNGLVDGDRVEDVLIGALAREPGEDLGSYAINTGTLAIADPYVRKYWMGNRTNPGAYWITDLPAANVNEDEVGDAQGSVLFLEEQFGWDTEEYLPLGERAPLGNSLNLTPGMTASFSVVATTSPTADVMIDMKTDPPVNWIWGEYSSWTPYYPPIGPFTFSRGAAPGIWGASRQAAEITPGPDASGIVTLTHTGLSADPKYNGRLGTFTINVVQRQPGECSSLAAPTVAQGADHVVGIAAGPAECGSRLIVGYETEISADGGPWQPLHSYSRNWSSVSGEVSYYYVDRVLKPATLEFAASPGVAYRVRSRGIADDTGRRTRASESTVYGAAKTIATSWSPVTDFTIADRALSIGNTDYDADADGLIEVSNLAQLDAIRWDLDGNGSPDLLVFRERHAAAFPDAASRMGCPPSGCRGYELTADLDFDTNGNGQADAGDTYWNAIPAFSGDYKRTDGRGWIPLGERTTETAVAFAAVFDGNGHVIRNLYISGYSDFMGLFSDNTGIIRNVGLESVDVTRRGHQGGVTVGGMVGLNEGIIKDSYVTGAVSGAGAVGGLVGKHLRSGVIKDSYATASVTGASSPDGATGVGGLVGVNSGKVMGSYATGEVSGKIIDAGGLVGVHWDGLIKASYATGDVSANDAPESQSGGGLVGVNHGGDIEASYATGEVSGYAAHLGGLVGKHQTGIVVPAGVVSASYWNTESSGLSTSSAGVGKTGAELVTPTGYAGIYADWNVDLDGDGRADDPWDFGTDSLYPVLKRAGPSVAEQRAWLPTTPELATYSLSATATAVEGENAALTITLSEVAPTGGVAFTVTAGYSGTSTAASNDVGSITSPVTVTEGNASMEIAIPTVGDDVDEDDETFEVTISAAGWEEAGEGRGTATVTITDDDTAGVTVTAANPLSVSEGATATYTVVMESQPTADVTITASSGDSGAASVSPASRAFTPSSWNTAQTFTVSGVADSDTRDETVGISHSVTSADGKYAAAIVSTVSVSVSDTTPPPPQQQNRPPTVASAIADATIVNQSGTKQVSLSGVFADADNNSLTVSAVSSDTAKATVSVAADYSSLTVTAKARGTASITVTANDGNGGTVSDIFTVTVKAAPTVASAIGDVSGLTVGDTRDVSLSGVFSDSDSDALTITAASSDNGKATVSVASDGSKLTLTGVDGGTATVTATARDSDGNSVSDQFSVTVAAPQSTPVPITPTPTPTPTPAPQQNRAPTVASAIADATIVNQSGTKQVSLSGVFADADNDSLTVSAASSNTAVATASVASGGSSLTVSAKSRGTAAITVTADDGRGGTVQDAFTVTVKAAPTVASAISDVSGLTVGDTRDVSLISVFSDPDSDTLTITAASSDNGKATVSVASDGSKLTLTGVTQGTVTITVTAQDSDGNSVSDAFDVTVVELPGPVVSLELTATYDSVTVSWSAPESGDAPQGYIVHIKCKGGGYQDTRRPGAAKTAVTFRGLNCGSTYNVWVRAQNEAGNGERVHATVTLPVELPGPVTSLDVTATADSVTVRWSAPETGSAPDGYIAHLRPEGGNAGSGRTKKPNANKTQVTFKNLEAGQTYKVWVRAQNEAGKGERVHATVTLPQAEPPADQGDGQEPDGQAGQ